MRIGSIPCMAGIFVFSNHFRFMVSRVELQSTTLKVVMPLMLLTPKWIPKKGYFRPLQKISMGQVCYKLPKIYNQTILNQMQFSLKNTVSCIIQNPVVSVWYYHLPFFSNIEIQVCYYSLTLTDTLSPVCGFFLLLSVLIRAI